VQSDYVSDAAFTKVHHMKICQRTPKLQNVQCLWKIAPPGVKLTVDQMFQIFVTKRYKNQILH